MARPFSSKDAENVQKYLGTIINKLDELAVKSNVAKSKVSDAGASIARRGVMDALQSVSVEELSREKPGIRIKALHDEGFHTMADIVAASRLRIARVHGISEDSAYIIKRIADQYVKQTTEQVRIRLSTDNKNKEATDLVLAIAQYKNSLTISAEAKRLLDRNKTQINNALEDLRPACCNNLKWLFTSKNVKEKAAQAYLHLSDAFLQDFYNQSQQLINSDAERPITPADAWKEFERDSIDFSRILEEVCPGLLGNGDSRYGLPEELAREIQDECFFPDGLKCSLRNYQTWGVKYILHQEKVLLGDEMGLGKTVQAIATMVSLKNTGATHFMVVCPASVITNWCREIVKHSKLSVIRIHGQGRLSAFRSWLKSGGVAVTTYETTGALISDDVFKCSLLVVDEAHYIKNPNAKRSQNVAAIAAGAERLLFMTGTALENKVDEMINLITMLQPDVASSVKQIAYMAAAPQFRQKVAPVYYRRKREDVLTELPELIESKEWCSLLPEEESLYENNVLNKEYAATRRVSWEVEDLKNSSKANRLKEIIEEATSEGRKVLVFSFFLDTIRKLFDYLGNICMPPINGSVSPQRRQEIIDDFDKAPAGAVLLAQIQSGGTGLNIQSASVVVICEPQFKPSIENQAISRAYRMGQARNVLVYRLLCEDTVDEKVMKLLEQKQAEFEAFADKSVAAAEVAHKMKEEVDETTFSKIIEEEIERIKAKTYYKSTDIYLS